MILLIIGFYISLISAFDRPKLALLQFLGAKYTSQYDTKGRCIFENCERKEYNIDYEIKITFKGEEQAYYSGRGVLRDTITFFYKTSSVYIEFINQKFTLVISLRDGDAFRIIFQHVYVGYYYNGRGPFQYGEAFNLRQISLWHYMAPICPGFSGPNCQKWCPYSQNYECDVFTGVKYCVNNRFGENCDEITQACSANPCQHLSKCENVGNTFKCNCVGNYIGTTCSDIKCTRETCLHGLCESNKCVCARGYEGSSCKKTVCNPKRCNERGTCTSSTDLSSFYCTCDPNSLGRYCEYTCLGGCQNGGKCIVMNNKAVCMCVYPYSGLRCELRTISDICPEKYCKNGGECEYDKTTGKATCSCGRFWTGPTCETPVCTPTSCTKGVCLVQSGCICFDGYEGYRCEVVSPIQCQLCATYSTCETTGNNIYCKCNSNFQAGEFCEHTCTPACVNGVCIIKNGLVKCDCVDGYEGVDCKTKSLSSKCDLAPCKNGGKCTPIGTTDYTCECSDSYKGRNCEESVCSPKICAKGVCLLGSRCICANNYMGANCSVPFCDASKKYCLNSGTCRTDGNKLSCSCPKTTTGERCEFACSSECSKHGICAILDGETKCKCDVGYYGTICQYTSEFAYYELIYKLLVGLFPFFLIGIAIMVFLTYKYKKMIEDKAMENALFDTSKLLEKKETKTSRLKEDLYGKFLKVRNR